VITIDPGHGGTDPGACGNGLREAEFALEVSRLVAAGIRQAGVAVNLTRTEDVTLLPAERVRLITQPTDAVVSVHANSVHDADPRGWEIYVSASHAGSERLGNHIAAAMRELPILPRKPAVRTRLKDDKLTDWYYVIREPRRHDIPAVLVECGFVSSAEDAAYMQTFWGRFAIAHAISKGVLSFLGIVPDLRARFDAAVKQLDAVRQIVLREG
jgi:N-acetylmuramoyl-L-alanine amidase